ncbi:MAG: DUF1559 domain-containing protein [Planctomycetaceae bacterium]
MRRIRRRGFTLIELLVVIAIIAILVALLLPAVQSVREAARRSQCQDHLHNIAIAMHNYESTHKMFPPGYVDLRGAPGGSLAVDDQPHWAWSALLLPFVEQKPLYDALGVGGNGLPVNALDANQSNFQKRIDLFTCPSSSQPDFHNPSPSPGYCVDNSAMTNIGVAITNYVGGNNNRDVRLKFATNSLDGSTGAIGPFFRDSNTKFRDFTDGASNTILLGERSYKIGGRQSHAGTLLIVRDNTGAGPTAADNAPIWNQGIMTITGSTRYPINQTPTASGNCQECQAYSSAHPGGCHVALGDGKVVFVSENIDLNAATNAVDSVFEAMAGMADGVPASLP